jgi:hypothetical protein
VSSNACSRASAPDESQITREATFEELDIGSLGVTAENRHQAGVRHVAEASR